MFLKYAIKEHYIWCHFSFWSFSSRNNLSVIGLLPLRKTVQSGLFLPPPKDLGKMGGNIIIKQVTDTVCNGFVWLIFPTKSYTSLHIGKMFLISDEGRFFPHLHSLLKQRFRLPSVALLGEDPAAIQWWVLHCAIFTNFSTFSPLHSKPMNSSKSTTDYPTCVETLGRGSNYLQPPSYSHLGHNSFKTESNIVHPLSSLI